MKTPGNAQIYVAKPRYFLVSAHTEFLKNPLYCEKNISLPNLTVFPKIDKY